MKLVLASSTKQLVQSYAASMPQAILLTGPIGAGLCSLARYMAEQSGTILAVIEPISKTKTAIPSISVEQIRGLYNDAKTVMNGMNLIIIDDADRMNTVAQNALLKLLEEPNSSVGFILTSHQPDGLLPTIRSRLQTQVIQKIDETSSNRLLRSLGVDDEIQRKQLLFIASGLPAELSRLAINKAEFSSLTERVLLARRFVEGSLYERLIIIDELKDNRANALKFIDMTMLLLRRIMTSRSDTRSVELLGQLLEAYSLIQANGNIRLQLMRAVL